MKKYLPFFVLTLLFSASSLAQEKVIVDSLKNKNNELKNTIRIEFLGKSPFFGLNFDRMIWKSGKFRLNGVLGISKVYDDIFYSTTFYLKRKGNFSPLIGLAAYSDLKKSYTFEDGYGSPFFNCFLLIGCEKQLLKYVDIQFYYSPGIKLFDGELSGVLFLYGGVNIGYKF